MKLFYLEALLHVCGIQKNITPPLATARQIIGTINPVLGNPFTIPASLTPNPPNQTKPVAGPKAGCFNLFFFVTRTI